MVVHVLVEGASETDWIPSWAKRLVRKHYIKMHPHQGKAQLLAQLPAKLEAFGGDGYSRRSERVLLLVDRDDDRCPELGDRLRATLAKISRPPIAKFRVAVVESEAFYLGDTAAIRAAWPAADIGLLKGKKADLDWTSDLFMRVIGTTTVNKRGWARAIAPHLGTAITGTGANRSPSFRAFASAMLELCGEPVPGSPSR